MIFIVINKKGGVGKSTFSNQILSSFLFSRENKKIKIIEIDDENNDNATFSKTEIMDCKILPTSRIKNIDEIFFNQENIIVDVGGNKTATFFLNEVKKINEFDNVIWFIPLGAGEQDNLNALDTFNDINNMDNNAKVIFVLSNSTSDDFEWEFLNFFGNENLDTRFSIFNQIETPKYLIVRKNSMINNARYFQKTIYDVFLNKTDFKSLAKNEDDLEKRKKLIFMNRVKNETVEYIEYLKNDVFPKIEEYINE